jgi:hypothetical protein
MELRSLIENSRLAGDRPWSRDRRWSRFLRPHGPMTHLEPQAHRCAAAGEILVRDVQDVIKVRRRIYWTDYKSRVRIRPSLSLVDLPLRKIVWRGI